MRRSLLRFILPVTSFHLLSVFTTQAQWNTTGNTGASGQWLGTNNAFPLTFKTNNTERASFSSGGVFKLNGLSGTGNGLVLVSSTGEVSRFNLGTSTQVLTGNGAWTNISTATGWSTSGTFTSTTNKVGIGVSGATHALEVSGNGVFSGFVAAQQFLVADIATVQGRLSLTNNMLMDGYDPIAGTRNEIYTLAQPFYLQSALGYNNNVLINHSNEGKVGIGTSSPAAKLHVSGTSKFDGAAEFTQPITLGGGTVKWGNISGIPAVGVLNDAGTSFPTFPYCVDTSDVGRVFVTDGLYASAYNGYTEMVMGANAYYSFIETANTNLRLNSYCGNNVEVCTGTQGNVYLTDTSGRVGVGTKTPEGKLQVKTGAHSRLSFGNALYPGLQYGTSYIGFNAARTHAGTWKTYADGAHNGGAVLYSNVIGDLFFSTLPNTGTAEQTGISDSTVVENTRFYIASTGEAGFGTRCIPGGFKVAVDGKIICEGVRVKNNDSTGCWPDYVFDAAYQPLSIEDLGRYVQQNKHLPGVPSQADVLANGVDLVEMNKALLKATEENSLYIIELKKANDLLRQEVETLKKIVNNK